MRKELYEEIGNRLNRLYRLENGDILHLLEGFEVNMQLTMHASGTATSERLHVLGLEESDKSVIFSIVREDRAADALRALEQKFTSVRGGKGIAYTVPLSCAMGVAIYSFLANATEAAKEERK